MKTYSLIAVCLLPLFSFVQAQAVSVKKRGFTTTTESNVLSSLDQARSAHEKSVKNWWNSVYEQYGQTPVALTARDVATEGHAPWHPLPKKPW